MSLLNYTSYAVGVQTARSTDGSPIRLRPTGNDIPRQMRDHLIHGSIGRFAHVAHFVLFVVQTRTA